MRSLIRFLTFAAYGILILSLAELTPAQEAVPSPGRSSRSRATPQVVPDVAQPAAQPDNKAQAGQEGEKKPEEKKADDPGVPPVKRPAKPETEPKPEDLKLLVLGDDEVRFNFRGAPWLTVLQQLAEVSKFNLDWQELPGDSLNLVTRHTYKLNEARDLINRHLLTRGYTMILHGEMLSVVSLKNIKQLNPAVIPEVKPEELKDRMPHEYVRTSFMVDTLVAKELEEQLKPYISPEHGRLNAVESVNRLEVMDTVSNLQDIHKLLMAESSVVGQERRVKQFVLEYTRAEETLVVLQDLLGIQRQSAAAAGAMNPQMMQQMQQMQQQMAQQAQQQNKNGPSKAPEEVRLVVNSRKNSILATAPPDKMAVIEQAVLALDMPGDPADSLFHNIERMQTYWLSGTDPETVVKMLEQIGGLEIDTKLEVDKKNKAIVAYASKVDQLMIKRLIDKLDGGGRGFQVIPLRRYEADYVAGTIKAMMGVEEEKKDTRRSRYSWYGYGNSNEEEEKSDKFRVEGDVENNQLLLWCNDVEFAEVTKLLEKLGEISVRGSNPNRMRILETVSPEDADRLLERLQKIWPGIRPNELILPKIEVTPETEQPAEEPKREESPPKTANVPQTPLNVQLAFFQDVIRREDVAQEPEANGADRQAAKNEGRASASSVPPVTISRTADGRLIISCQDPAALDVLEELMEEIAPPQKSYKMYYLKYVSAGSVAINLEDFFKEDDEDKKPNRPYWYYWEYGEEEKSKEPNRLSKRKPIKFIWDYDTNSIMVRGGDAGQWKTVEDLIKLYDVPEPTNTRNLRYWKTFKLQYASAESVSTVIKDVYRDLLSANDKALADQDKKKESASRYTYIYGDQDDDDESLTQKTFKGMLSMGIDEKANMLIVSAPENILKSVELMVTSMEDAAKPIQANMHVVELAPGMDAASIQSHLSKLLTAPASDADKQKQEAEKQKQLQLQQQQQQNSNSAAVLE